MKVLVVLVLAVFADCDANPLYADSPRSKLEVMVGVLSDFIVKSAIAADKTYQNLRRTEFGNAVVKPLEKVTHAAGKFVDTVTHNLPPTAKAIIRTSAEASYNLASHVSQYIVTNHLEPMVESAAPVMEGALGELIQESQVVQDAVSPYITELMERLDPIFQDIQARLYALHHSFVKTE